MKTTLRGLHNLSYYPKTKKINVGRGSKQIVSNPDIRKATIEWDIELIKTQRSVGAKIQVYKVVIELEDDTKIRVVDRDLFVIEENNNTSGFLEGTADIAPTFLEYYDDSCSKYTYDPAITISFGW